MVVNLLSIAKSLSTKLVADAVGNKSSGAKGQPFVGSELSISQVSEILGSEGEEADETDSNDSELGSDTEDTTLSGVEITLGEEVSLGLVDDFISCRLRVGVQESEMPVVDVSESVSSHCYSFFFKINI